MEIDKHLTARVGLFVILGLALLAVVVFLLGGERGAFSRYVEYTASFESIEGLKPGSPVRLAGMEIGTVTGTRFYPDPADRRIQVRFKVKAEYADRIRADTTASIGSRGLLGDKVVDLTLGSPDQPQVPVGGEVAAAPPADFTNMLAKGQQVLENTVSITSDLKEIVAAYNTSEFKGDVGALVSSARSILDEVRGGKGALNTLIYDAETGKEMRRIATDGAAAARQAEAAIGRVDRILAEVQKGDSLVGALLFDPKGKAAVGDLSKLADELGQLAEAVRTQEAGLLHQMIYGSAEGPNMGEELAAAASDLRAIVAKVKEGEGSLGALINDPTVYEDLKSILGNVKRNRILRELVRYSISQSDEIESYGKKQ